MTVKSVQKNLSLSTQEALCSLERAKEEASFKAFDLKSECTPHSFQVGPRHRESRGILAPPSGDFGEMSEEERRRLEDGWLAAGKAFSPALFTGKSALTLSSRRLWVKVGTNRSL